MSDSSDPATAWQGQHAGSRSARHILRLFGWRVVGAPPSVPRYVLVGAHHTTNWDLPLALLASAALGVRMRWLGKHTLFRGPFGRMFRALGGIPVDRTATAGLVDSLVEMINTSDSFVLAIAPEGTRSRAAGWKTGFYRIAAAARVPIVLGFLDASRKEAGLGPAITPSGDLMADFASIAGFYADKRGIYPEKESPVAIP